MPDILSLAKTSRAKTWGRFSVEVDMLEPLQMLEGIRISYQPYSLADWMEREASPLMAWSITERFAGDGGGGFTGGWAPLQESTIKIKEALGVNDPEGINTRTEVMFEAMVGDHSVSMDADGSTLQIPGDPDAELLEKLRTAAHGKIQGPSDMIPGAVTPPRPVAVMDQLEVAMLLMSLELHIMQTVGMMMGATVRG